MPRPVREVVETVSVELPGGVSDVGLNVHVAREGQPVTLRLTLLLNPFKAPRVAVYVVADPRLTVRLEGDAVRVKSGVKPVTVRLTVVLCCVLPPVPVTVIG